MSLAWRTIRFQSDENVDADIIAGLLRRQPAIDILTATQAGLLGQGDPLVLAYAADQGRILLTHDEKTMPGHLADFLIIKVVACPRSTTARCDAVLSR